jgi:mono/diheme cytochrome c family protein
MKLVRRILRILLVLITLLFLIGIAVFSRGRAIADRMYERALAPMVAATDSASLVRGRHLADVGCVTCHSLKAQLPLAGSGNFIGTAEGRGLGTLYAPNLTPGGLLAHATDPQLARAIREGIGVDGRGLFIMPSGGFRGMGDADLAALLGYLRSQPAVRRETPPRRFRWPAFLILGFNQFVNSMQPAVETPVATPASSADAGYGAYLTPILGCRECHGPDYRGRPDSKNGPPGGPDLMAVTHDVPLATFQRALRSGIGRDGRALDPQRMPWLVYSRLTDLEIAAVYQYLHGLSLQSAAGR